MKLSIFPKRKYEIEIDIRNANIQPYMWACPCNILAPMFIWDVTSTAWVRATNGEHLRELAMRTSVGKENNYVRVDLNWTQKSHGQPKRWCFHTVERRALLGHYRPLPCLNKTILSKRCAIVDVFPTFYEGCKGRSIARLKITKKVKISVRTALRPWISRTKKKEAFPRSSRNKTRMLHINGGVNTVLYTKCNHQILSQCPCCSP